MTCRSCIWLKVAPDKAGRRAPRKDKSYLCEAPVPDVVMPLSITRRYDWRWPPSRNYMAPDEGAGCPTFKSIHGQRAEPYPNEPAEVTIRRERGEWRAHEQSKEQSK